MDNGNNNIFDFLAGVTLAFLTILLIARIAPKLYDLYFNKPTEIIERVDTIVTEKRDTFVIEKPQPVKIITKTKTIRDTLVTVENDTVVIDVPQEAKVYQGDTLSTDGVKVAWRANISGYRPSLDTLSFNIHRNDTTIIKEITKFKWKKGFRISPQVGVGYGFFNKKPDMYVGVGVGYTF